MTHLTLAELQLFSTATSSMKSLSLEKIEKIFKSFFVLVFRAVSRSICTAGFPKLVLKRTEELGPMRSLKSTVATLFRWVGCRQLGIKWAFISKIDGAHFQFGGYVRKRLGLKNTPALASTSHYCGTKLPTDAILGPFFFKNDKEPLALCSKVV